MFSSVDPIRHTVEERRLCRIEPERHGLGYIDSKMRLPHIDFMLRTVSPDARVVPAPEASAERRGFFQRLFGRPRQERSAVQAAPLEYDAKDIEEDNRISNALRRQHAPR